jgi:hypothetical protein
MKKLLTTLFLLAVIFNLSAEISVKSFRKLENDLDARVNAPIKDFSGDVSAIIKVITTQTGFTFDCGQAGIVKTINKPSEIWVYVPYGVKRITILHPQLGQLRDWIFTQPIEKATVYEMVLVVGKVITTVEETIESQWLVINPEPTDASVYIDDVFVKTGTYQIKKKPGTYTYRVEAPLYHTEAGKIEISDIKKELIVNLKPAYGFIDVSSEPEKDAKVIIDGKTLARNTPTKSEALASGQHTVQVIKEMYQPTTQKVIVTDGQTTPISFKMQPNFAELTINSTPETTLFINGNQKETGTWTGRLNIGIYSIEARLDKHRTAKQDIELAAGDKRTVFLQPTPIFGSLDVITSPIGAIILINGKNYGTTPNTITKLLIGDYTVQLTKTGFASVNKSVTVIEGKSIELNEKLLSSGSLKIMSNPNNGDVFIDEKLIGKTPIKIELSYGKHTIKVTHEDKTNIQVIDFSPESTSEFNIELYECNKYKLITSSPNYATIFINGEEKGSTPLNYKMLNAEESITIKKDGYKTYRDKIYCQGAGLNAFLQPKKEIDFSKFFDNTYFGLSSSGGMNASNSLGGGSSSNDHSDYYIGWNYDIGLCLNYKISDYFFEKTELSFNNVLSTMTTYGPAGQYGYHPTTDSKLNLKYAQGNISLCGGIPYSPNTLHNYDLLLFAELGLSLNGNLVSNQTSKNYSAVIIGLGLGNYDGSCSIRLFLNDKLATSMPNGFCLMLNMNYSFNPSNWFSIFK